MIYDTLPKGGASQFHPHVHGFLATEYLSHMKIQNLAATAYKYEKGEEFWTDFIEIHHALGLTVRFGDAIALSPLVSNLRSLSLNGSMEKLNKIL